MTETAPTYNFWRESLAGKKPKMFVDCPELGFYRKGVYEKQENKARKRVGWTPIAVFMHGDTVWAVVGPDGSAKTLTDRDQINELWSYIAGNPISEETYRAVAERGEGWPDSHDAAPALPDEPQRAAEQSPAEKIAAQVKADVTLIAKYKAIDSDEMASKARSLQNKLLDSRGEAAKAYEAANRPLLDQQKALREIWFPIRDAADAGSKELATAMGKWEDTKRAAARLAQEAADKLAREHAEAARKAEAANQPPPPPPPEVKPNTPAPSAQIRGGAGRAASVKQEKFVTEIRDIKELFEQFKSNEEVRALLTALAQKGLRAGIDVAGVDWEWRSVVR
jgi:hypothetical protein